MSFFSAKNATVRINNNTLTAKQWNVEPDADEIDVSNFEGAGFSDVIVGLRNARVTIEFDLDSIQHPWVAPLNLSYGLTVQTVSLFFSNITGTTNFWAFPVMQVLAAPNPMNVKEAGKASVRLRNKGSFTPPLGALA